MINRARMPIPAIGAVISGSAEAVIFVENFPRGHSLPFGTNSMDIARCNGARCSGEDVAVTRGGTQHSGGIDQQFGQQHFFGMQVKP